MKSAFFSKPSSMLSILILLPLVITGFLVMNTSSVAADFQKNKLIKLESKQGVKLKFVLIKPTNPVASVILLEGGPGILNLDTGFGDEPTVGRGKGFLSRTRKDFAKSGLMVALVDKPSERKNLWPIFRMSGEHAQDLKAVVSYLKSEADVPIWLVGMSMGTFSAPNGAIRLREEVDGLVLVSSVTRCSKRWKLILDSHPNAILDMDLDQITVPTLITHHRDDKSELCPPSGAEKIKEALVNSKKAETMYFSGGKTPVSGNLGKPCGPLNAHGYYGIENEVVSAIVDFIKANSS